jgi:pyruvate/2-oxoglutarate dehydrogenase complex dihydrolipoamide acyltransferase (E2) component
MTDTMLVHGELMHVPERVVVTPAAGIFRWLPLDDTADGDHVTAGQPIGVVEGAGRTVEVRSPFAGSLMGRLAETGERLRPGQPVAWLRIG